MSIISTLFGVLLYQPLFNALVVLYQTAAFRDLGIAIILLTAAIRLILYPLFYKSFKNQTLLQKIQPEVQRIQRDHKHDRNKQTEALMTLYKTHKVNPFSGFLLLLVQIPILIALYKVFLNGFSEAALKDLYGFIPAPSGVESTLLGLINLSEQNILIIGLAALAQYIQGRMSMPKKSSGAEVSQAERISKQMVFIGPALTILVLYSLPAAVGLYWLTTSVFSALQQAAINNSLRKEGINGTVTGTDKKNT